MFSRIHRSYIGQLRKIPMCIFHDRIAPWAILQSVKPLHVFGVCANPGSETQLACLHTGMIKAQHYCQCKVYHRPWTISGISCRLLANIVTICTLFFRHSYMRWIRVRNFPTTKSPTEQAQRHIRASTHAWLSSHLLVSARISSVIPWPRASALTACKTVSHGA